MASFGIRGVETSDFANMVLVIGISIELAQDMIRQRASVNTIINL
jgi:hypothetical protein